MTGVELIAKERERQVTNEMYHAAHDNDHEFGELAMAAACYAAPKPIMTFREVAPDFVPRWVDPWPWDERWDKRGKHNRIRQLTIAGALIAAEIDRLQRAKEPA